ncbi:MAG: arginine--tRNA ligase [Elusimicrobia bacterium RIFCSPLOWO2_01_FULL_54_10]|nr:MAG: arginine--tRNA ligase [Elusimicrobia bacterium RIFCSPLOWO2_01_FULL_54_10]
MIRSRITQIIKKALSKQYPEAAAASFSVDEPGTGIAADVSTNTALALTKKLGVPPAKIADELIRSLSQGTEKGMFTGLETARGGFVNFVLHDNYLRDITTEICLKGQSLGPEAPVAPAKVMIEFVSANPTGPLHIGHGRGASLGDSLARIYRQCGYPVQTEYYVNDVGVQMQILAQSTELRSRELEGESVNFPENGYQGAYVSDIAKEMAAAGRNDFDKYPREYILNWIRKDLEDFGVPFDAWFSESELFKRGKVEEVLSALRAKGLLKEKDGALWFISQAAEEDAELDKDRVLKKSDGRYTYFASDIAYHKDKFDRGFGLAIDIWGHDHHGYVPRVEASISALGIPKEKLKILLYQLVSLKRDGKKVVMSTRSGQFVTLKEVVDEVGRDAARFFFALRSPNSQLEFDVDLAKKQSNENPVYYVQYVHARICSIFREAEKRGIKYSDPELSKNTRPLEKAERDLVLKMGFFTDVLEGCLQISSPHLLAVYLMDLATRFHKFYDACRVLDAEPAVIQERLKILQATRSVVKLGLSLLGVSAPEKM